MLTILNLYRNRGFVEYVCEQVRDRVYWQASAQVEERTAAKYYPIQRDIKEAIQHIQWNIYIRNHPRTFGVMYEVRRF